LLLFSKNDLRAMSCLNYAVQHPATKHACKDCDMVGHRMDPYFRTCKYPGTVRMLPDPHNLRDEHRKVFKNSPCKELRDMHSQAPFRQKTNEYATAAGKAAELYWAATNQTDPDKLTSVARKLGYKATDPASGKVHLWDVVTSHRNDIAHAMGNCIKQVFNLIGNSGDMTWSGGRRLHELNVVPGRFQDTPHQPFHAKGADIAAKKQENEELLDRVDEWISSVRLPAGDSLKNPFRHTAHMKMHDHHLFCGDIGVWLINRLELGETQRCALVGLLYFLADVLSKVVERQSLEGLRLRGYEVMSQCEIGLPVFFSSISNHLLIHIAEPQGTLEQCGPASVSMAYSDERAAGVAVRSIRSRKNMCESIMRNHVLSFFMQTVRAQSKLTFDLVNQPSRATIAGSARHLMLPAYLYSGAHVVLRGVARRRAFNDIEKGQLKRFWAANISVYSDLLIMLRFHNRAHGTKRRLATFLSEAMTPDQKCMRATPCPHALSYGRAELNGVLFRTEKHEQKLVTSNCGVRSMYLDHRNTEHYMHGFLEGIYVAQVAEGVSPEQTHVVAKVRWLTDLDIATPDLRAECRLRRVTDDPSNRPSDQPFTWFGSLEVSNYMYLPRPPNTDRDFFVANRSKYL
jgi:hypothetical protein